MKEIERRFLVDHDLFKDWYYKNTDKFIDIYGIVQGYFEKGKDNEVLRIRSCKHLLNGSSKYTYTRKKNISHGINEEVERVIDKKFFSDTFKTIEYSISKTRVTFKYYNNVWEVDRFLNFRDPNGNHYLIAEVELKDINQKIRIPKFMTKEITGDNSYSNYELAKNGWKGSK